MGKSEIKRILLAAAAAAVFISVPTYAKEQTMPEGLFVGEASLGGMTEEEARQRLTAEQDRLAATGRLQMRHWNGCWRETWYSAI